MPRSFVLMTAQSRYFVVRSRKQGKRERKCGVPFQRFLPTSSLFRPFLFSCCCSGRNELAFYNPEGHHAAFALPPVAMKELAKARPSLGDTCSDLESIMVGEESEDRIDNRWEPDVRARGFALRVLRVLANWLTIRSLHDR